MSDRFTVVNEDPRVSRDAVLFIQKKINEELAYLPAESVVDIRLFTKKINTGDFNDFAGRCWYKSVGDVYRNLQKPVHIRITTSVGPSTTFPFIYEYWRTAPRQKANIEFGSIDDVFVAIVGHEVKHALLYYSGDSKSDWRTHREAHCDIHGRKWFDEWKEAQKGEEILEQVQEFLQKGDTVDYAGEVCKVAFQFKNIRAGQMVHLVDNKGNEYRNIPYAAVNKTDAVMSEVEKKNEESKPQNIKPKRGVIDTIVHLISGNPLTKEQLLDGLAKEFPDREREKMKSTVNAQLNRLKGKFNIIVSGKGKGKTYTIKG